MYYFLSHIPPYPFHGVYIWRIGWRYIICILSLYFSKIGFSLFAWWYLTLSTTITTFWRGNCFATFTRKLKKEAVFPLSATLAMTMPVCGSTHPNNVLRSLFLCICLSF